MTRRATACVRPAAAVVLVLSLFLVPVAGMAATPDADTASPPAASPPPMVVTGDSRSDGGGPGLVGSPVVIALGVVALGVITAVGTLVVLRVSGRRRP